MLSRTVLTAARRLFRNWVKYTGEDAKSDPKSQIFVADILHVAASERLPLIERDVITATGGVVSGALSRVCGSTHRFLGVTVPLHRNFWAVTNRKCQDGWMPCAGIHSMRSSISDQPRVITPWVPR